MGNRKKSVNFSVSDDEYRIIAHEARAKGLKIGQYAKTATFSNINRYPSKGTFAMLYDMKGQKDPDALPQGKGEGVQDSKKQS